MKNSKFIIVFAVLGFVMSFIFALTSHSSLSTVILKAAISGISFAVLGFVISLIYTKFLDEDTSSDVISDVDGDKSTSAGQTKGQIVDLVVSDAELEKGDSGNSFVINDNRQMLNENDVSKKSGEVFTNQGFVVSDDTREQKKEKSDATGSNGFVPLKNFETVNSFSSKEAEHSDGIISLQDSSTGNIDSIDALPEMNNISVENTEKQDDDEDDVSLSDDNSSEFTSSKAKNNEFQGDMQNAALIAKAISSVLSAENN